MMQIKLIQPHQIEEVKHLILAVCQEIFQVPEEVILRHDSLTDIDNFQSEYFNNTGTFLVLVDNHRVVGSGAIRRINNDICELKRMFFLKDYRGRGLGMKIAQKLLNFAKKTEYKKVRLDTRKEMTQALKLYKKLGFYFIERYNNSSCTIFMEKKL
ncbi:GNAT family N-acetyltransferase [Pleurocapsales cyanobacterium LEGE 06147]|nr:GNAT family N-acetyltransferase [Pleurocapsales cyanobacterium LEGE 06147]